MTYRGPSVSLDAIVDLLRAFVTERGVAWIEGRHGGEDHPLHIARFYPECGIDVCDTAAIVQAFTNLITTLDAGKLFVTVETLTQEQWQSSVNQLIVDAREQRELGDVATAQVLEEMLDDVKEAEWHIGQIGHVRVEAIARNPPLKVDWSEMAVWFQPIVMAGPDRGDSDESAVDGEPEWMCP